MYKGKYKKSDNLTDNVDEKRHAAHSEASEPAKTVKKTVKQEKAETHENIESHSEEQKFERSDHVRDSYARVRKHKFSKLSLPISITAIIGFAAILAVAALWAMNLQGKNEIKAVSAEYKTLQGEFEEAQKKNEQLQAEYDKLKQSEEKLKQDYEILKKAKAGRDSDTSGPAKLYGKNVYLTFDDGPSPVTPKILKTLKKYDVKATFFVINSKYNDYMTDMANEGHTVALHTYCHDYSKIYQSTDVFMDDLQKISDVVYEKTGKRATITRFPGGSSNTISARYSKGIMTKLSKMLPQNGYHYFDWNADSGDASGNNIPASKLIANVKRDLSYSGYDNYVLLMHDAAAKKTTADALPEIIEWILAEGGTILPLDESVPSVHHGVNN